LFKIFDLRIYDQSMQRTDEAAILFATGAPALFAATLALPYEGAAALGIASTAGQGALMSELALALGAAHLELEAMAGQLNGFTVYGATGEVLSALLPEVRAGWKLADSLAGTGADAYDYLQKVFGGSDSGSPEKNPDCSK
jgi:hypothetical protein